MPGFGWQAPAMADLPPTDRAFPAPHLRLLAELAQCMIPADGELPSAADPAIFADIVAELARDASVVAAGLDRLEAACADAFAQPFAALSADERLGAVARLRAQDPAFVARFEAAVATCYYRDARVQRALGMPGRPPFPGGYAVKPTDWSLLDPVRQRTPFHRDA